MDTPPPSNPPPLTRHQRRELERQRRKSGQQNSARTQTLKRVLLWTGILVVVGGAITGAVLLSKGNGDTTGAAPVDRVVEGDWVKGNRDAKNVLVEFSDLQCPACKAFQPAVKRLAEKNSDGLAIVYRHFPLRQIHKNADRAARFAEAAGRQGKFWEFHDQLFEEQSAWADDSDPTDQFLAYAESLGLDREQLRTDADSAAAKEAVTADSQSASAAGVSATPTFYLNGQKLSGFKSIDDLVKRVEDAIAGAS